MLVSDGRMLEEGSKCQGPVAGLGLLCWGLSMDAVWLELHL